MHVEVISDNLTLTQDMRQQLDEKLGDNLDKLLEPFADDTKFATVRIIRQGTPDKYYLNFDIWLPGDEHIFARADHMIFSTALVDLEKEIRRQIEKYRGRLRGYD